MLLAGCGTSSEPEVRETVEPRQVGPAPPGPVIDEGPPGWSGAVEGTPPGLGRAVVWTGDRLIVAGYGSGRSAGVLRVAMYSPASGDWTSVEDPFVGAKTTGPALGFDLLGRVYLAAGMCGERVEGDGLEPGECPYIRRMIKVLDQSGWSDVEVSPEAQNPEGRDGDATQFTGALADAAGFDINHRPFIVDEERTHPTPPPPGGGQHSLCTTAEGTLSLRFETIHGDPLDRTVSRPTSSCATVPISSSSQGTRTALT